MKRQRGSNMQDIWKTITFRNPDQGTISHMLLLLLADYRHVAQRSQIWPSFRLFAPNSAWV